MRRRRKKMRRRGRNQDKQSESKNGDWQGNATTNKSTPNYLTLITNTSPSLSLSIVPPSTTFIKQSHPQEQEQEQQEESSFSTSPWIPPSQIYPFLYLGSIHSLNDDQLTTLGITHILSLCSTHHFSTTNKEHQHILIHDTTQQDLRGCVKHACECVDAARAMSGACLVHCSAGVSRSPAVVLAYMVLREQKTLAEAYKHVKEKRKQVAPNMGFWQQLLELEREVLGRTSMSLDDVDAKKGD